MTATLTAGITDHQTVITITDAPALRLGSLLQIEAELVGIYGPHPAGGWEVVRGRQGSTAVAHNQGVEVGLVGSVYAEAPTDAPTTAQTAALDAANAPDGDNPFATLADVGSAGVFSSDESDAITGADTPSADNPFATIGAVDSAIVAAAQETFWYYDFDIDGGAQGTIGLRGPLISVNSFVNAAFVRVITPFTSDGSATVALTTGESAGDIDTTAAYDNAKYSAGFHAVSVHKFMTDDRPPAIVIAGADLTAGKIEILLDTSAGWS